MLLHCQSDSLKFSNALYCMAICLTLKIGCVTFTVDCTVIETLHLLFQKFYELNMFSKRHSLIKGSLMLLKSLLNLICLRKLSLNSYFFFVVCVVYVMS